MWFRVKPHPPFHLLTGVILIAVWEINREVRLFSDASLTITVNALIPEEVLFRPWILWWKHTSRSSKGPLILRWKTRFRFTSRHVVSSRLYKCGQKYDSVPLNSKFGIELKNIHKSETELAHSPFCPLVFKDLTFNDSNPSRTVCLMICVPWRSCGSFVFVSDQMVPWGIMSGRYCFPKGQSSGPCAKAPRKEEALKHPSTFPLHFESSTSSYYDVCHSHTSGFFPHSIRKLVWIGCHHTNITPMIFSKLLKSFLNERWLLWEKQV